MIIKHNTHQELMEVKEDRRKGKSMDNSDWKKCVKYSCELIGELYKGKKVIYKLSCGKEMDVYSIWLNKVENLIRLNFYNGSFKSISQKKNFKYYSQFLERFRLG